ncbi:MAG TPA: efflux RND transporter periplasmic adaptor subunit [Burkholderiales bacterium]|nr:efflux RND transporter periplasmic adaptor subunit [Burkholderiales bacterium]
MKTALPGFVLAASVAAALSACGQHKPPAEALRQVRVAEVRYDASQETNRYFGSVQARYEVDQGFRVGGKVVARRVDVGQKVRRGDVLATLDDTDYKLAAEAAEQGLTASQTQARQAESDRRRLEALKADGSVSASDDERATSNAAATQANAEADARKLELARNRLDYTRLRASQDGVITSVKFEVGQVVAEGQPVVSIAKEVEPEIVVNVPEDQLAVFKASRYKAALTSAPGESFDVVLRELSPQAASTTRTFRARLKPAKPRMLPLGASATLMVERPVKSETQAAAIPASAITQSKGQPAVWIVRREGPESVATVNLSNVVVHEYRNDVALVSGPNPGELVVIAGVQKMAPGLKVALPLSVPMAEQKQAAR